MDINEMFLRARVFYEEKNFDEALKLVEEIKRLNPKFADVYLLEILILKELQSHVKLIAAVQKILPQINMVDPPSRELATDLSDTLGHSQIQLAMHDEALKSLKMSAQFTSDNAQTKHRWSVAIFYANHVENFSVEDFRILYNSFKKCFADIKPFPKKFYEHEKIRVGFLAADFRLNVTMVWSWALVAGLDRNNFEIYFYASGKNFDRISEYLHENADGWRDISDLTDEQAATLIHDDETDILFDLSGYTVGSRLFVMAYHPAAVQVSGIGYMNSTGLDAVDYFLSDVYCAGNPDYFTEKLLVLPHSHFCYAPFTKFEPAKEPPCIKNNFVTFGSFNRYSKVTESILRAWKKILDAVPDSRLLLKHKIFDTEDERKFVGEQLKNFGFDLERVEMRGFTYNHMHEYDDVDIALDTFPYTGGVTTCDALYMGVPVISFYGDRHGSRFGLSILSNVGLEELAVDSWDDYINRAVALAGDWELLKILRKNLRGMMEKSPLMDGEGYVREIEKVFVSILDYERSVES